MPLFRGGRGGAIPTSALQLNIREVCLERAIELNGVWHSTLPVADYNALTFQPRRVAYEAQLDDIAYAVGIWTTPMAANRLKDGWKKLELRRLAISDDAPKNTATRMLAIMTRLVMKKWPDLIMLLSYQHEQHHKGTIYKAAGWKTGARSESQPWHAKTQRDLRQTKSATVRWELALRESPNDQAER